MGPIYDDLMDINRGYFQKCMWRGTFSRDPVMRSHVVSVIGNLNNPMKEVMLDQMLKREPADNVKELIRHKLSQIRRDKERRRLNSVNRKDSCKFIPPAGVSRRASESGLNRSNVNII